MRMSEPTLIYSCNNLKCIFNAGGYCTRAVIDINEYGGCAHYAILAKWEKGGKSE